VAVAVAERSELTRRLRPASEGAQEGQPPGTLLLLSPQECRALLARGTVGRLAYIARAGVPDITPVNYTQDGDDIIIRSGPGPKLQAAERRERVAFEVDEIDDAGRAGASVVVHGVATRLSDAERRRLPVDVQPAAAGPRRRVIRIRPEHVSGRRLS
jgi:hypothetical protein